MGTVGGTSEPSASPSSSHSPPAWAHRMRHSQSMGHGVSAAAHAVRSGDNHGGGASVSLSERDRT
ncbi:MAG: P-type conjugative transfer protein TrbL, partial [Devosia sp.]